MPRKRSDTEWVTAAEAGRRLGISAQAIGVWGTRSESPTRMRDGQREYQWPNFPRWREEQLEAAARDRAMPADFEEARTRKMAAEAELAELELAKARGDLITVNDAAREVASAYDGVRARLLTLAGRIAPVVIGVKTVLDATSRIEPIVYEVMEELSGDDRVEKVAA